MKAVCGASSKLPKIPWELLVRFWVAMKISRASKKPTDDQGTDLCRKADFSLEGN